jgi:hypothetical protein
MQERSWKPLLNNPLFQQCTLIGNVCSHQLKTSHEEVLVLLMKQRRVISSVMFCVRGLMEMKQFQSHLQQRDKEISAW